VSKGVCKVDGSLLGAGSIFFPAFEVELFGTCARAENRGWQ
jgi:hypothetical protein